VGGKADATQVIKQHRIAFLEELSQAFTMARSL
jgi:hypothetical protein